MMYTARMYMTIWSVSFSFLGAYGAWASHQAGRGDLLYYLLVPPVALFIPTGAGVPFVLVLGLSFVWYSALGLAAGSLAARMRLLRDRSSFWDRHRYVVRLGPMGGFLWFASFLLTAALESPFAADESLLFFQIFFLPLYVVHGWEIVGMPHVADYVMLLLGAPAQYLAIGLAVDRLRGCSNLRRRAVGLLCIAFVFSALLLYFAVWGNPHDPYSTYPRPHELKVLVGAWAVPIGVLVWLGVRAWRGRRVHSE